jgi:hypothetical protein
MNKKNVILLASCGIVILAIYALDLYKLTYRLAAWEKFKAAPVVISHIEYFVADTPDILGYTDHTLGETVTCYQAVAFVETETQENYRCCDTDEKISCIKGDFSSDIPSADDECITELKSVFGVPDTLAGAKEYQFYGNCSGGSSPNLTVVQLDTDGNIQWKYVEAGPIQIINSVLRCVLGPILLLIVLWVLYGVYQGKPNERIRKF